MRKNLLLLLSTLTICLLLTGCGEDPVLAKFHNDINSFCTDAAAIDAGINSIDASSATAKDELLDYLDQLDQSFQVLANIPVPKEYAYLEGLADEAGTYMTTAVAAYHDAFAADGYDEANAVYARQNYERAYKRVTIILQLLRGEEITDADVHF